MDEFDFWRLADSFTLIQAAMLIAGVAPSEYDGIERDLIYIKSGDEKKTNNSNAALSALVSAVTTGTLKANRIYESDYNNTYLKYVGDDEKGKGLFQIAEPSLYLLKDETRVSLEDLKEWLRSRGLKSGFFFPEKVENPDYLNPEHKCYAPKLAASVFAWTEVSKQEDSNRTVKQRLDKMLREHAAEFGLTDDEGKIVENAIDQCAQVANWNTKGGAPKSIPQT